MAVQDLVDEVGVPRELFERLVRLRRDLHRYPELSGEEHRTARQVAASLRELGLEPREGVGGTGLVVDIPGQLPGPFVALRADMDALPVVEESGLEFASDVEGVMHACGHDAHTAMLLGAGALLLEGPPPPLPVRLLFQPAEEQGTGAQAMLEAGALEGVAGVFGGHVDPTYATGELGVAEGAVNAATDSFRIEVIGQGGHGARPHQGVDAVVVGSLLVAALQTIAAREVDPAKPCVVTVGSFHSGTAGNVLAGRATLQGTLRSHDPAVRAQLREALARVAAGVAAQQRARIEVVLEGGSPPVVNPPGPTRVARRAGIAVVGEERVLPLRTVNMGGEDFGFLAERLPSCYVRIGCRVEGSPAYPAHSGRFLVDERAIAVGASWFAAVARRAGGEGFGEASPGPEPPA
jgi:hippurate hydrolase